MPGEQSGEHAPCSGRIPTAATCWPSTLIWPELPPAYAATPGTRDRAVPTPIGPDAGAEPNPRLSPSVLLDLHLLIGEISHEGVREPLSRAVLAQV